MIVSCDRCASQFQLDEAKVPEGGTKVRCSRCQHAFVVRPSAQPAADLAETWVRDTLSEAFDANASDVESVESAESDWGFNDDRDIPEAGMDAAREAVEDLLGEAVSEDSPTGASSAPAKLELEADPIDASTAPDSDFADAGLDLSDDSDFDDGGLEESPEDADLGKPSKWDFFDEEAPTTYAEVPPPEAAQTHVDSSLEASISNDTYQPLVGLAGVTESDAASGRLARMSGVGGWAAVVILIAVSLFGGLSASQPESGAASRSWSGGGFDVDDVHARWVDNASAGPMYVISGRLRRSDGSSPWDAVPLAVELTEASGAPVDGTRSAIGPEIPIRYLRESNVDELIELQTNRARQFAAFAGTWLKFDAVVASVPGTAERYSFVSGPPTSGSGRN